MISPSQDSSPCPHGDPAGDHVSCPACGGEAAPTSQDPLALAIGSLRRSLFAMAVFGLVASAIVHEGVASWRFAVHLATDGGLILGLGLLAPRAPRAVVRVGAVLFVLPWALALARSPWALADPGLVLCLLFFTIATVHGLRRGREVARLAVLAAGRVPRAIVK